MQRVDPREFEQGDIVDTRVVSGSPETERMEWHLVVNEDYSTHWVPRHVSDLGEILNEPIWMPLPGSQYLFLQCPVYEALYEGTRGPGKTLSLIFDFAKDVGRGHGSRWRGILFRREYKDLDDVVKKIEEWFPQLWPGFRFLHSKAEYMAIWPTGEKLLLRAGENEEVYSTYHGHEYPWIGFEELTQWEDDKLFLKMQSCCRSTKPGMPCRVRATTNPFGAGHNWVKKRYQLPQMRGRVVRVPGEMPRVAIHGSLSENFLLLHADPLYPVKIRQSTKNPNEAKAWIEGDWDVTAGGMIDDIWDPKIHILRNLGITNIPRGWSLTRAYDHGQSHPFSVGWWAESNGEPITLEGGRQVGQIRGDLILVYEWYGCVKGSANTGVKMPSKKIATGIVDRQNDWLLTGRVIPGPADTEIFNKLSDRDGHSPADDMAEKGVEWERADKSPGSRKRGWEVLRDKLAGAVPSDDGTREEPGLFVCERCEYWLELIPPMPRDTKDQDEIPAKYEDHCADMTRYRITWEVPGMWRRSF